MLCNPSQHALPLKSPMIPSVGITRRSSPHAASIRTTAVLAVLTLTLAGVACKGSTGDPAREPQAAAQGLSLDTPATALMQAALTGNGPIDWALVERAAFALRDAPVATAQGLQAATPDPLDTFFDRIVARARTPSPNAATFALLARVAVQTDRLAVATRLVNDPALSRDAQARLPSHALLDLAAAETRLGRAESAAHAFALAYDSAGVANSPDALAALTALGELRPPDTAQAAQTIDRFARLLNIAPTPFEEFRAAALTIRRQWSAPETQPVMEQLLTECATRGALPAGSGGQGTAAAVPAEINRAACEYLASRFQPNGPVKQGLVARALTAAPALPVLVFEAAITVEPRDLARLVGENGAVASGIATALKVTAGNAGARAAVEYARSIIAAGEDEKAAQILAPLRTGDTAVTDQDLRNKAEQLLARTLVHRNDWPAAVMFLREIEERTRKGFGEETRVDDVAAELTGNADQCRNFLGYITPVLQTEAQSAGLAAWIARCREVTGDLRGAAEGWKVAAGFWMGYAPWLWRAGRAAAQAGQAHDALTFYKAIIEVEPSSIEARALTLRLTRAQSGPGTAIDLATGWIRAAGDDPEQLFIIGEALRQAAMPELAVTTLRLADVRQPGTARFRFAVALSLIALERPEDMRDAATLLEQLMIGGQAGVPFAPTSVLQAYREATGRLRDPQRAVKFRQQLAAMSAIPARAAILALWDGPAGGSTPNPFAAGGATAVPIGTGDSPRNPQDRARNRSSDPPGRRR
jgi:hypothetical protein